MSRLGTMLPERQDSLFDFIMLLRNRFDTPEPEVPASSSVSYNSTTHNNATVDESSTPKQKSKREGATPSKAVVQPEPTVSSYSPILRGRTSRSSSPAARAVSPPAVQLSPFWIEHIDFFNFLSSNMPKLVSEAVSEKKTPFKLISDPAFKRGYYTLDASRMMFFDSSQKKYLVIRTWDIRDIASFPCADVALRHKLGWWFQ